MNKVEPVVVVGGAGVVLLLLLGERWLRIDGDDREYL